MTDLNPNLSLPTCRVCLQNNDEDMSSIYDLDADLVDLHIYEKIEQCAGIKIVQHEGIPTLICSNCYGFLKVSYKFRTICRNSNEYLKEFVFKGKITPQPLQTSSKENPLSLTETNNKKISKRSHKSRLKQPTPLLSEIIKVEKEEAVDSINSATFEEFIENVPEDEMWLDIDNHDDENYEVSIEAMELEVKEESEDEYSPTKKSNRKKKSTPNAKKSSKKAPKTLSISSDGAAVIRERKPRVKSVKKDKEHICDVCGNFYQRRYALELHMRRHQDIKPFDCEICSQAFHSNFELIRHMRKHTGLRPYKCRYCERAFGDQSTLIKHERIHRNERPFKCETCGKSFTYSNVLKSHKLTHTGEKPYTCELCGKCFTRSHHLRAHLETLQHQSDPRSKILLQNIKKNNEGETLKIKNIVTSL